MLSAMVAVSLVMVVTFFAYLASIVRAYLKREPDPPGEQEFLDWHMFIPCRDEEVVIGTTAERLRTSFPTAHVWVIDDDSDDDTALIVNRHAQTDPMVHLVQRRRPFARTGKGDALNAAYAALSAFLPEDADRSQVIVCVVDADGQMAENALAQVAGRSVFGNPRVGAAQVAVHMRNRDDPTPRPECGRARNALSRYLVRMQDLEFRTTIAAMQALRVRTRSVGLGGNGQFTRLSVLDEIATMAGAPWHGALLEDYELGLHVLLAGYENRYVDETHVSQEGVTGLRRLMTQRTRWSQGNIQCIKYLPQILRSRAFCSAGVIEAGYYLLLPFVQMLGLFLWPALWVLTISRVVAHSSGLITTLTGSWWLAVLLLVASVAPFVMWGPIYRIRCEPSASRLQALAWGFGLWLYVYYMYISVSRAFIRLALRRSGWVKTRRNGEDFTVGALASEA